MRIQATAPNRKSLVKALADHLGEEAIYTGPRSFAYKIGNVTVDREGGVILPEDMDPENIRGLLISNGWVAETEVAVTEAEPEADSAQEPEPAPDPENAMIAETDRLVISIPADGLTVPTMHKLLRMLYSKQYLLGKALKEETIRVSDEVIEQLQQSPPETLDDFKARMATFNEQGFITGIELANDRISLSFPMSDSYVNTYTLWSLKILEAAKAATRVQAQRQEPENEKYFMRGWLVRLGFGGKEAKGMRELFLKHLKGNSAFLTEADAERHQAKYAAIRRSQRDSESSEVADEEG